MRRQGIGRTQAYEMRLALRALRVARRHVGFARNLHRCDWALRLVLGQWLRDLGELERAHVDVINEVQRPRAQRRAA